MKNPAGFIGSIGLVACFLACIGDFLVTTVLGVLYKGYNFLNRSESYLGTSDSPVLVYMTAWEIMFCLFLVVFALGLRRTMVPKTKWSDLVFWMVLLYAFGEGLGSGIFPFNHAGAELTLSGKLHNVFSGIGMTSIVLLPLVVTRIFKRDLSPKFHLLSLVFFYIGLFFAGLFLLSKAMIIPYRGLWQRIFLLDYHLFLMVFALKVKKNYSLYGVSGEKHISF